MLCPLTRTGDGRPPTLRLPLLGLACDVPCSRLLYRIGGAGLRGGAGGDRIRHCSADQKGHWGAVASGLLALTELHRPALLAYRYADADTRLLILRKPIAELDGAEWLAGGAKRLHRA
jgi:hypothetical protein